jgi:hypothetical protein
MTLLRRFHLAHPEIPKIVLINSGDREVALNDSAPAPGDCFASPNILFGCCASAFRVFIKARSGQIASKCNISSKP